MFCIVSVCVYVCVCVCFLDEVIRVSPCMPVSRLCYLWISTSYDKVGIGWVVDTREGMTMSRVCLLYSVYIVTRPVAREL